MKLFSRTVATTALLALAATLAAAQFAERSSDFNGDGYDDLAIGIPGRDFPGATDAGAVRIIYGSDRGLGSRGTRLLRRGAGLPADGPRPFEQLGATLAVGDFNGDGLADLAIGAPLAPVLGGDTGGAGNVIVAYGGSAGLGGEFESIDPAARGARFGTALVAGDFNDDGFDELAIGAKNAGPSHGAVVVFFGTAEGLRPNADNFAQPIILRKNGLGLQPRNREWFGASLASADFDGDGFADLAVGSPGAAGAPGPPHGGDVVVVYGSPDYLDTDPAAVQVLHQDTDGILGVREPLDHFGETLAAADLNGRGSDDLVIGVPGESLEGTPSGTIGGVGVVHVVFGGARLEAAGNQQWHQNTPGVPGEAESGDRFGDSLAIGDFNADGRDDLVIGVERENFVGFNRAGVLHVLYGPPRGSPATAQELWHQDEKGLAYGVEEGDLFGAAFGVGDYDGDGHQDLAIGAPGERLAGTANAGSVVVLYGSGLALGTERAQVWAEHSAGLRSNASENDRFGTALSVAAPMSRTEFLFPRGLVVRDFDLPGVVLDTD